MKENIFDYYGWLDEDTLVELWEEVGDEYPYSPFGDFSNSFGLDEKGVMDYFRDYREYLIDLMDNDITSKKYGREKDFDDFDTQENLLEYYDIYQNYLKKECPFSLVEEEDDDDEMEDMFNLTKEEI